MRANCPPHQSTRVQATAGDGRSNALAAGHRWIFPRVATAGRSARLVAGPRNSINAGVAAADRRKRVLNLSRRRMRLAWVAAYREPSVPPSVRFIHGSGGGLCHGPSDLGERSFEDDPSPLLFFLAWALTALTVTAEDRILSSGRRATCRSSGGRTAWACECRSTGSTASTHPVRSATSRAATANNARRKLRPDRDVSVGTASVADSIIV